MSLRNLCDTFLQESETASVGFEGLCSLHSEELKLFCLVDKQPVCYVCRDSIKHTDHEIRPVDETACDHKKEIKSRLEHLEEKLKTFEETKVTWDQTVKHIKKQALNTEKQIKEEFERLHRFLRKEEATRIFALREEQEQKSQMMKEKIEEMSREISSLSDTIRDIEEQMGTDDVTFLQNYKSTVRKAQCTLQDPERVSGVLINVAKHLGNLKFRVWEKMQDIIKYTPVILDPNTAHPHLFMSEDLTSVRCVDEREQLPDNPERFEKYAAVLGSEGFNSGTHCWDVEVGENDDWVLGVITESHQRKGDYYYKSGIWYVKYTDVRCVACSPPQPYTSVKVKQKPQRIRVQLDWNEGKLSFIMQDNNTHIHTFKHNFTERVFPYFATVPPMRIVSVEAFATKQLGKCGD